MFQFAPVVRRATAEILLFPPDSDVFSRLEHRIFYHFCGFLAIGRRKNAISIVKELFSRREPLCKNMRACGSRRKIQSENKRIFNRVYCLFGPEMNNPTIIIITHIVISETIQFRIAYALKLAL